MNHRNIQVSTTFVEKEDKVTVEMQVTAQVNLIYCQEYEPINKGEGKPFISKPILKELDLEFYGLESLQKFINNLTLIHNEMLSQMKLSEKFLNGQSI
jgi:hypothetical protein